jgi:outer membrane protein insertion porin family
MLTPTGQMMPAAGPAFPGYSPNYPPPGTAAPAYAPVNPAGAAYGANPADGANPAGSLPAGPLPPGGTSGGAAKAPAEEIVMEVRIEGNRTVTTHKITDQIHTRTGRPYNVQNVQDDVRALTRMGLFVTVEPRIQPVPGGVVVIFRVTERPLLQDVEFVGNDIYQNKALKREAEVKAGDAADPYAVENGRRKIEEFYKKNGYSKVRVTVREGNNPGDLRVVYVVDEGPRQRVLWINFVGNTFVSGQRLKTVIESHPPYFYLVSGEYNPKQVDEDVNKLTAYYRGFGYFHATIGREVEYNEKQNWVTITFVVNEGPRYSIRNISFLGNRKFDNSRLADKCKLLSGQYFDQNQQNLDLSKLRDEYGGEGYVFAKVEADNRFLEEPGKLDIVYTVEEGSKYRVGRINIEIKGENPHTQITTVLNRLSVKPGDIADTREIRNSERRLKSSQLFKVEPAKGVEPKIAYSPPDSDNTATAGRRQTTYYRCWCDGPLPPLPPDEKYADLDVHDDGDGGALQVSSSPAATYQGQTCQGQAYRDCVQTYQGETYQVQFQAYQAQPQQAPACQGPTYPAYPTDRPDSPHTSQPLPTATYRPLTYEGQTPQDGSLRQSSQPQVYEVRYGPYDGMGQDQAQAQSQPQGQSWPASGDAAPAQWCGGNRADAAQPQSTTPYQQPANYGYTQPAQNYAPQSSAQQPYYAPPPQQSYGYAQQPPGSAPVQQNPPYLQQPAVVPVAYSGAPAQGPSQYPPYNGPAQGAYGNPAGGAVYSPSGPALDRPIAEVANSSGIVGDPQGTMFPQAPGVPLTDLPLMINPEETQTGRLMFGVGVNSDAGLVGNVTIDEQNFDWRNVPDSWEDVMEGRAWRGAGERLRIELVPGTEVQRYMVSYQDPYLNDLPLSFGISGFYYQRIYTEWTEERVGGSVSLGYQFTHDLTGTVRFQGQDVTVGHPEYPVPTLLAALGRNPLYTFSAQLQHDTRDNAFMPTEGHLISGTIGENVGSYQFPTAAVEFSQFFKLFQRADRSGNQILNLDVRAGYSGDNTPIFERFYAGGFSSIRGFAFRGVTPRDPVYGMGVGGDFQLLGTAQYLFPITADDMLKGVIFVDAGTVEPTITDWNQNVRVAPGFGLRIAIPMMGPAPIALDFAFPVTSEPGDVRQVFSFFVGFNH